MEKVIDVSAETFQTGNPFQNALHFVCLRKIFRGNGAFRFIFENIGEHFFQNVDADIQRARALFQNQSFLADDGHFLRPGNVFTENIPAVDRAIHFFRKKAYQFFGFVICVYLQFPILGIVESEGQSQYQQRSGDTAACSALTHAGAKTGAYFESGF